MFYGVYKKVLDIMKSIDKDFSENFDKFVSKLPREIEAMTNEQKAFNIEVEGVRYQMSQEHDGTMGFTFENKQDGKKVVITVNDLNVEPEDGVDAELGYVLVETGGYDIVHHFDIRKAGDKYDVKMEKIITSDYICVEHPVTVTKSISYKEVLENIKKNDNKKTR